MPGQSDSIDKGGTLRLGAYPCSVQKGTLLETCYLEAEGRRNVVENAEALRESGQVENASEKQQMQNLDSGNSDQRNAAHAETGMVISERHRHRYEFNNDYRKKLTDAGLVISGLSPDGELVETVELSDHPFFLGVQFHPEFKSRPNRPQPIFRKFVETALEQV